MTDVAIPSTLSPLAAGAVVDFLTKITTSRAVNFELRTRLEEADRRTMREHIQGEKELELTVPIITPQVSSMVAYLSRIFLSTPEIFPMAAAPDAEDAADQYNALLSRFADIWQWRRNLMLAFQDGAKYNLMAVEACWAERKVGSTTNEIIPGTNALKTKQTIEAGFSIKHLDLYNTFWDMTVEPAKVSEDADFAGYYEVMTSMKLRRFLDSLPDNSNFNHKLMDVLKSVPSVQHYYIPQINRKATTRPGNQAVNWDTFLTNNQQTTILHDGLHEVTTVYARIVPKDFAITKNVPAPGSPQIWKFVVVNGIHVVYAERRTNAHDKLPIVFGQPREDGLSYQTKSLAEELFDVQKLSSILWSMEIESTRRVIADRGLYNPQMVRAEDINNSSPTAKIPVRNAAYGQALSQAYYPIPYEDRGLGTRAGTAQQLTQFANAVSGQNQVQQGQFVKGNKTNDQFDQVMAGSDARQIMMALLLEDQFFMPIKTLLKSDMLQYQQPVEVFDKSSGQMVQVDPAMLRASQADFVVTDGLMGIDKVMSTDLLTTAMQTIASSPQLASEYNLAPLFNYLMKLRGVKGLDKFAKTDAEKQADQQAAIAQEQAMQQAKQPQQPTQGMVPNAPPSA